MISVVKIIVMKRPVKIIVMGIVAKRRLRLRSLRKVLMMSSILMEVR